MELWKKNWALIRMFFGGCFHRSQKPGDANRSWLDLIPKRWVLSRLQPLISGHVSLNHPKKVTFSLIIAMEVCPSLVGNRLRKGNKVDSCDSHFQTWRWFWNFKGAQNHHQCHRFPLQEMAGLIKRLSRPPWFWRWSLSKQNHPIGKENHLNQATIFRFQPLIFQGDTAIRVFLHHLFFSAAWQLPFLSPKRSSVNVSMGMVPTDVFLLKTCSYRCFGQQQNFAPAAAMALQCRHTFLHVEDSGVWV